LTCSFFFSALSQNLGPRLFSDVESFPPSSGSSFFDDEIFSVTPFLRLRGPFPPCGFPGGDLFPLAVRWVLYEGVELICLASPAAPPAFPFYLSILPDHYLILRKSFFSPTFSGDFPTDDHFSSPDRLRSSSHAPLFSRT